MIDERAERRQWTCSTQDMRTYYVSRSFVRAWAEKFSGGYTVVLHSMDDRTFHVDADSADQAHMAVVLHVRASRPLPLTGATITRRDA